MKLAIRIIIVILVLLVAVVAVTQLVVHLPFVRLKATKILGEMLKREVTISGMSLRIFPSVGITLQGFKIHEKNKKDIFVGLENIRINVALLPLLMKKIVVKSITLDQPEIHCQKDSSGQFNFSDLMAVTPPANAQAPASAPPARNGGAPAGIFIDSFRVNDARFFYNEILPNGEAQTFQVNGLNLAVDHLLLSGKEINADYTASLKLLPSNTDLHLKGFFHTSKTEEYTCEMKIILGSSDLSIQGKLQGLDAPKIQLDVTSSQLNLKDLPLLMSSSNTGPENPLCENKLFQSAQGTFSVQFKSIRSAETKFGEFIAKASLANGILSIKEASFNASEEKGKVSASVTINLTGEKIGYELHQEINGLELQPFVTAIAGKDVLQGTLVGKAAFKGMGLSLADLEKSLSGKAYIEIKDGRIVGKSLNDRILEKLDHPPLSKVLTGLGKMQGEAREKSDSQEASDFMKEEESGSKNASEPLETEKPVAQLVKDTEFRTCIMEIKIADGKVELKKLKLKTDDLTLRGSGKVDFAFVCDLSTEVAFSKSFTETMTGGKDVSSMLPLEKGGLLIPVRITGTVMKPVILPDVKSIVTAMASTQVEEKTKGALGIGKKGGGLVKMPSMSRIVNGGREGSKKVFGFIKKPFKKLFGGHDDATEGTATQSETGSGQETP